MIAEEQVNCSVGASGDRVGTVLLDPSARPSKQLDRALRGTLLPAAHTIEAGAITRPVGMHEQIVRAEHIKAVSGADLF